MNWLDRQSFLGPDSSKRLDRVIVSLVGVGGGNSHVAQQLAHAGVGGFVLVDSDHISITNLNRLIGGTWRYVKDGTPKVEIMRKMILAINPNARIEVHRKQWQEVGDRLRDSDVVVGGLDSIRAKDELDAFCRRFLIPYVDQGMDVHLLGAGEGYLVAGQVVLSQPGSPCLRCLGIVTEDALAEESRNYGSAGGQPQVVWPNGVLASLAVGFVMQLITPWNRQAKLGAYLAYDGNSGLVTESARYKRLLETPCSHYPPSAVGDMGFDIRTVGSPSSETTLFSPSWVRGLLRKFFGR